MSESNLCPACGISLKDAKHGQKWDCPWIKAQVEYVCGGYKKDGAVLNVPKAIQYANDNWERFKP